MGGGQLRLGSAAREVNSLRLQGLLCSPVVHGAAPGICHLQPAQGGDTWRDTSPSLCPSLMAGRALSLRAQDTAPCSQFVPRNALLEKGRPGRALSAQWIFPGANGVGKLPPLPSAVAVGPCGHHCSKKHQLTVIHLKNEVLGQQQHFANSAQTEAIITRGAKNNSRVLKHLKASKTFFFPLRDADSHLL